MSDSQLQFDAIMADGQDPNSTTFVPEHLARPSSPVSTKSSLHSYVSDEDEDDFHDSDLDASSDASVDADDEDDMLRYFQECTAKSQPLCQATINSAARVHTAALERLAFEERRAAADNDDDPTDYLHNDEPADAITGQQCQHDNGGRPTGRFASNHGWAEAFPSCWHSVLKPITAQHTPRPLQSPARAKVMYDLFDQFCNQ